MSQEKNYNAIRVAHSFFREYTYIYNAGAEELRTRRMCAEVRQNEVVGKHQEE